MDVTTFPEKVIQLIKDKGLFTVRNAINTPVVRFVHPINLQEEFDFNLYENGCSEDELLKFVEKTIDHSVDTSHPHFFNQLYGGVDLYGLSGAMLTDTLNTNQYTFEVAPVFSLAEHAIIKKALHMFKFAQGDGIFSPGGSISNMYGMVLARYKAIPEVKSKGLLGHEPLIALTSEDAHYSVLKSAHWLGIGTNNVLKVKSDDFGSMDTDDLEDKILQCLTNHHKPFVVIATAGTTIFGSFDPFKEIATLCNKYGLWLHVDACWGGSFIFSEKHSELLSGIERADSISWNPHKMLGAPLQCSLFLVKEQMLLHQCNSASATYLFQQDKFYDTTYDSGDKSVQCGRKTDAYKLWLMWRARGDKGFAELVDNAMECAKNFTDIIRNRDGFQLVLPKYQCTNICFWYIPPSMRDQDRTAEWWEKLAKVAPMLKEKMILQGTLMLGYQPMPQKGLVNFFRMVTTCQPMPTKEHMSFVVCEIERLGKDL